MNRSYGTPKCGCMVEQVIRDYISSSPESRQLAVRCYRYSLSYPASADLREELEQIKKRLDQQFYLQFVRFVERENIPLRLTQELFLRHADDLLEHRFNRRRYRGKPR